MRLYLLLVLILIANIKLVIGQVSADTAMEVKTLINSDIKPPWHRNVIRVNPTPMLLWGDVRNLAFGYERLIGRQQSVGVQAGFLLLPRLFSDTIANLVALSSRSKSGVNLAINYRFYPGSRNRRPAPDGVYLGGYLSFYGYNFGNDFNILHTAVDQAGHLSGRLRCFNAGMELGYQFVFWKRFTVDLLLFGPSLSYYDGKLTISGNLDAEEIRVIDEELVEKLLDRFPYLKTLFDRKELEFTGSKATLSFGFRYSIQFGFHF